MAAFPCMVPYTLVVYIAERPLTEVSPADNLLATRAPQNGGDSPTAVRRLSLYAYSHILHDHNATRHLQTSAAAPPECRLAWSLLKFCLHTGRRPSPRCCSRGRRPSGTRFRHSPHERRARATHA